MYEFLNDIRIGLVQFDLWRTFAWDEIQQRYRRSVIGIAWIFISYAIFVFGVAVFFAPLSGYDSKFFITYVAIGYATYMFLIGNIVDGCSVFTSSQIWIKSVNMPYSIYIYKSILRSLVTFFLHMSVCALIMAFTLDSLSLIAIQSLVAIGIFVVNAVAVQYFFGLLSARLPDISHLVTSFSRLLIFVTPIVWVREGLTGPRALIADFNPLTHYMEIFRAPLLGQEPRLTSWVVVLVLTAVSWILAVIASVLMRRKLPFWI